MARMTSDPLIEALRKAGIADDDTRRVVIDIQAGNFPVIYVERYGDDRLISIVEALAAVEVRMETKKELEA